MPSGRTHFWLGLVGGAALVYATAWYAGDPVLTRAVAVGAVVGLLVTPDLDQEGSLSFTERLICRVPLVGWLWVNSWWGYAHFFKHRGASHSLIFGTATRVAWLALIAAFWLLFAAGLACAWDGQPRADWLPLAAGWLRAVFHPAILVGWYCQDAVHVIADRL